MVIYILKTEFPQSLANYSQEELALEIASLLERIGPSFIHLTDLDIVPAQDKGPEKGEKGDLIIDYVEGPGGGEKPIDPEREEFLRSLKDAKFMSANRHKGLKGYVVVFFDNNNFILIENQYTDNAAFLMDLPEKLDMKAIEAELLSGRPNQEEEGREAITRDELRKAVEERYWRPISEKVKTRNDLKTLGAKRYVHTPGKWQDKFRKAIESRMDTKLSQPSGQ